MAALSHLVGHDILGGECGNAGSSARRGGSGGLRRRRGDQEVAVRRENKDGRGAGGTRTSAGWITSRVMCESDATAFVVNGLSEGASPASCRAILTIFNLVFWASRNSCGGEFGGIGSGAGGTGCGQHGPPRAAFEHANEEHSLAGGQRNPTRRAAAAMLDFQNLLPRLLRIAEHGEGTVLRAKAFLALCLALEMAPPALLLKACRSRLLPLLARTIGALGPRAAGVPGSGVAPAAAAGLPGLSPHLEYLYECCTKLADWLCTVPEGAARRLSAELRTRCARGLASDVRCTGQQRSGSGFRRLMRQPTPGSSRTTALEAAMATFPAVVHLINSPLLRGRAVTRAFVSDVSGCIALSCPIAGGRGGAAAGKDNVAIPRAAENAVDADVGGTEVVLAALLPTVETLAQQAEQSLWPHWETVSTELFPVLCQLLRGPSGDLRALAVAVLRLLLPPLLRQSVPVHSQFLDRNAHQAAGAKPITTASPDVAEKQAKVRSAVIVHLLPLAAALLSDHTPIPQYTVRLLVDVGREWNGLGVALLAEGCVIPALIDRLPRSMPLSQPAGSSPLVAPRPTDAIHTIVPSPNSRRVPVVRHRGPEPEDTAAALDPAVAALLTLLVERDDGGGGFAGRGFCDGQNLDYYGGSGVGGGDDGNREALLAALLRLELPGRVAAAVAGAVEAGMPESTEAFLGLAVALLDAGAHHEEGTARPQIHSGSNPGAGGGGFSSPGIGGRQPAAAGGQRADGNRRELGRGWEEQLEPLLAAVPAAVEGVHLFCVRGGLAERREQLEGTRRGAFVDGSVRSGVSDSATLYLKMCYEVRLRGACWLCFVRCCLQGIRVGYDIRPIVDDGVKLNLVPDLHAHLLEWTPDQRRKFKGT